jgi:hypothetical protein
MIISKKKYQEQLKEAACRAETEAAMRMHREKSREEDERRTAEQFRELRRALDNQKQEIYSALHQIDRRLRQVEFRTQGPDHPILWGDDESYYLKFYIFQVIEEL